MLFNGSLSRFRENKPSAVANPFLVISTTNAWLSRCLQYILTYRRVIRNLPMTLSLQHELYVSRNT